MKRTEIERIERELKRTEKKQARLERGEGTPTVGQYIDQLFGLFLYDENEIFNAKDNVEILELLEQMKDDIPEKKWDDVVRKAIKKTKVRERDRAAHELYELIGMDAATAANN